MRELNAESEKQIKQWEALILFAYDDFDPPTRRRKIRAGDVVRGTLTIGYGHTGSDVKPGMVISQDRAEQLFRGDIAQAAGAVERLVKVPLNDNQFGALVSFVYNVGTGNFQGSTLLKKLNAGNYDAVPGELMKWVKSKGKRMNGLVNRRASEAGLWSKGAFVQSAGSPVSAVKPPLVSGNAVAVGTSVLSTGALQFVPTDGPLAWALAAILVGAAAFLLWRYIERRRQE